MWPDPTRPAGQPSPWSTLYGTKSNQLKFVSLLQYDKMKATHTQVLGPNNKQYDETDRQKQNTETVSCKIDDNGDERWRRRRSRSTKKLLR